MKKALLVLGGASDQVFMIKTAKEMGFITVCVDGDPNAPGLTKADFSRPIDFKKIDQVINYCLELVENGINLSGVSTMGSDIPHILSEISSFFNWEGPKEQTGLWATHKLKMKNRFKEKNIPIPKYGLVKTVKDIINLREFWQKDKVIIKPTDRAGSRGVRLININDDLHEALDYAKRFSFNKDIILEEFILGPQISTETIMYKGSGMTVGFADRVYEDTRNFYPIILENGGWLPSKVSTSLNKEISNLVERAARVLGIENGVAKGDIIICPSRGPIVIEMAARLSGGDFSESLVPLSSGINYVRTMIDISLGNTPDLRELKIKKNRVVANRYFFPVPGDLEKIVGIELIKKIPQVKKVDIYVKKGDTLPVIDSHNKRAGVFIVEGNDRESVQKIINQIYETVKFEINGSLVTGDPRI